jgi:Zn finger protein HypA/HybF involved in hydrogenase expression
MVTIFECLKCGHESKLEALPARCPKCGTGNGVLRESPAASAPSPAPTEQIPAK